MSDVANFVRTLDIAAARRSAESDISRDELPFSAERQALVVGSQMVEFTPTMPKNVRPVISDSLLLAHLGAEKVTGVQGDPVAYMASFCSILGRVGWLPVGGEEVKQDLSNTGLELNKAIIPVLAAAFGPAATAVSIIISALNGLENMDKESPWLTLFSRRTQKMQAARFGLNYVDAGEGGGALLKSVLCTVNAQAQITQVLFAKFSGTRGTVTATRRDSEFSASAMAMAAAPLATKLAGQLADNIAEIDIDP